MKPEEIRAIALEVAKKVYGIRQEVDYEEVFNVEEDEFHLQLCARFLSAIAAKAEPVEDEEWLFWTRKCGDTIR